MRYCIDTSGLTNGWKNYSPDFLPDLWKDIEDLIDGGGLISAEEVLRELEVGGDDLYQWALKRPVMFVPSADIGIQQAVAQILSNPEHAKLIPLNSTAKTIADPYVIATAKVQGCTVISNERLQLSPSPNKTKIPNVCQDLGITHLTFLEFIKAQGWIYKR